MQSMLKPLQQFQKPPRNICYGTAKTSGGEGPSGVSTLLSADVSLVASGVGKGCTEENLKDFLVSKGINPVEVELLTRQDVIENVRTLTFRVAVKATDYEASLNPEVWPYRVAVRHYRAPRRDRTDGSWQGQSQRSGGQVDRGVAGVQPQGQIRLPTGHPGRAGPNQQTMAQTPSTPLELRNFYSVLASLGGGMGP